MARLVAPIRFYLITDRKQTRGRPLAEVVAAALRGGVDAVQLREKDLGGRRLLALAREILPLCRRHGAHLLINDRVDVALAVDADGVHLPANSFSVADARALVGDKMVGVSAHSAAEADAAARAGADFVVLGPIYPTPSKLEYGPPLGATALQTASARVTLPVIAVGGIEAERAREVRRCGAAGLAVVRAVCAADDPEKAAAALCAAWRAGELNE